MWNLLLPRVAACSKYRAVVLGLEEGMQSNFLDKFQWGWIISEEPVASSNSAGYARVKQSFSKTREPRKRYHSVHAAFK